MIYSRESFGKEMKSRLAENQSYLDIAAWAYDVYLGEWNDYEDVEFSTILIFLNCMENGDEFVISYNRLNEIADDLIAGKRNINMDY